MTHVGKRGEHSLSFKGNWDVDAKNWQIVYEAKPKLIPSTKDKHKTASNKNTDRAAAAVHQTKPGNKVRAKEADQLQKQGRKKCSSAKCEKFQSLKGDLQGHGVWWVKTNIEKTVNLGANKWKKHEMGRNVLRKARS